ncbi:hypothetical protein MMC31_005386 [Peltigera leucophlebia]|nr:hypothetical protein [Peltigera leucophlebia]
MSPTVITFPLILALTLLSTPQALALSLGANSKLSAVSASSTVTNSGFTVLTGDLSLSPGTAVTGFPPGTATSIEIGSAIAIASEAEAGTTYGTCVGLTPTFILSGDPLAGLTLGPGIYQYSTTAVLAGTLTLDASGDPDAQFIFQIGTSISTGIGSDIVLINGAKACNVFFCVGSSAILAATNTLNGVFIAHDGITVGTGTSDVGGLFALNGAVTLLTNAITNTGTSC